MTSDQQLQAAIAHHQAGRLTEAEAIYRQILASDPDDADVFHLLGMIAQQRGRSDEAVDLISRAIELDPVYSEAHFNLGKVLADTGRRERAIASYQTAIRLDPEYFEAHFNLGALLLEAGQADEAIASIERAVQLKPDAPGAHTNLGNALTKAKRYDEATAAYRRAIELKPDLAEAHNNIGNPLRETARFDEALTEFRRAIELKPDFAEAHSNLASVLGETGDLAQAVATCRRAIQLKPEYSPAHLNLGKLLLHQNKHEEAIASFHRAIELNPNYPEAHQDLGEALLRTGQPDEAIVSFQRAIQLHPDFAEAHSSLGNARKDKCQIDLAIASYRKAVELSPGDVRLHSNLLYALHFDLSCSPAVLLHEHRLWAHTHADPLKRDWPVHRNDRDPNHPLRVGYVSPDFRGHAVGRFILPLLAHHDHQHFKIFCYASVRSPDDFTAQIRGHADVWRDITTFTNEQAARLVEEDRIDILVDLTMHTAKGRLNLFARKPAPIQVAYLAYPGTTGLDAIDYRITDPYLDPPESNPDYYSEQSLRLPKTYWCYEPPLQDLALGPPCAVGAGFITFGCLNNFCKVTPFVLKTWTALLADVPNSRLMLHATPGSHRDTVREIFENGGIDSNRITFIGKLSLAGYFDHYRNIDIALDPFPYVGGTTTCDALWMGCPVVSLSGTIALSRGGVSILSNVGLPELIAQTPGQYIHIAAELAKDITRLDQFRLNIRERMRRSPLMDAKQFASDFEKLYRKIWHTWCVTSVSKGRKTQ